MSADVPVPSPEQILDDPAASYWLKQAVHAGLRRDPVDVASDAQILSDVFSARALAVLSP
jgi:hypothetical protein